MAPIAEKMGFFDTAMICQDYNVMCAMFDDDIKKKIQTVYNTEDCWTKINRQQLAEF